MEEHLEWMKGVSRNIDTAYDVLCDYEKEYNGKMDQIDQLQIMSLLETVNDIHMAAQSMRVVKNDMKAKQSHMQTQLTLLENAIEMLQLEAKTKAVIL